MPNGSWRWPAHLPDLPLTRERLVHGDPKISNFIFDPDTDEAIGLVDLDTVASMPIVLELGDAFRSWCNPLGEDTTETTFSLPFFHAAIGGYARGAPGLLSEDEWQALPDATLTIALELAARFAADALQESYFGWDTARFEERLATQPGSGGGPTLPGGENPCRVEGPAKRGQRYEG